MTNISYCNIQNVLKDFRHLIIVGYPESLKTTIQKCNLNDKVYKVFREWSRNINPKDKAEQRTTFDYDGGTVKKYTLIVLPSKLSRHLPQAGYHCALDLLEKHFMSEDEDISLVISLKEHSHVMGFATMLARANPIFNMKTPAAKNNKNVRVSFLSNNLLGQADFKQLESITESVRLSCKIIDTPTNMFSTREFVRLLKDQARELGISCTVIEGEELKKQGLNGILSVGAAADNPPALVILSYNPPNAQNAVAWVGKGITYDTGGLSLKPRDAMPKMKSDMAGAAAVLGALRAVVKTNVPVTVHAAFCIAENAVGPKSYRPDDIIQMYSGKSVEVNNTDAEGRLVLADGIAYISKKYNVNEIVDIATLTGAQLIATGTMHAGVLTASEKAEKRFIKAGLLTGEPLFPLIYAPEILMPQFKSTVADMKNSVESRFCAQSSAAGHFVEQHIHPNYQGTWVHLDIAGPARDREDERGTGFGVTLLYASLFA